MNREDRASGRATRPADQAPAGLGDTASVPDAVPFKAHCALTNLRPSSYADLHEIVRRANAASGFECELVERPMMPGEHWCSYNDGGYARLYSNGALDTSWHLRMSPGRADHSAFWAAFREAVDAQATQSPKSADKGCGE